MWPLLIAGSALAGYLGVRNTNRTNYQIAQDANKRDLKLWQLQNEYNKPLAQMERFKEAGLNPNLIYTQGNAGNASSINSTHTPIMANEVAGGLGGLNTALDVLSMYNDYQVKQAQIDQMRSATLLNNKRIVTEGFNAELRDWQGWTTKQNFQIQNAASPELVGIIREKYNQMVNQSTLTSKEIEKMDATLKKMGLETTLLEYQKEIQSSLKDYNMSMSDELWQRLLAKVLGKLGL